MNRRTFLMLAPLLSGLPGCATPQNAGPGMIVTFSNGIKGKSLLFDGAVTSSGAGFPNPGSLAPSNNLPRGGSTEGAAPDGRNLPEWVEFEWRETIYQKDYTYEQLKALPHKTGRVIVRSRVPQDVIDEVIESKRKREPHKLPEKMLWVYFVWTDAGIKFRWELQKGCCEVLRSGGDKISAS